MPEKDFSGNNKPDFIHCICINARSLCNKLFELHGLLYSGSFDIIFVVESWLTADKVNDALLDPKGQYTIYRHDRNGRSGGGVCAFIARKHMSVDLNIADSYTDTEVVGFQLKFDRTALNFLNVYRAPGTDNICKANMSTVSLLTVFKNFALLILLI